MSFTAKVRSPGAIVASINDASASSEFFSASTFRSSGEEIIWSTGTVRALAIDNTVSIVGRFNPRSICETLSSVRPIASANAAWVIPLARRISLILSPISSAIAMRDHCRGGEGSEPSCGTDFFCFSRIRVWIRGRS